MVSGGPGLAADLEHRSSVARGTNLFRQNPGCLISVFLTGKGGIYKGRSPTFGREPAHILCRRQGFFRLPCSVELKKSISYTEK